MSVISGQTIGCSPRYWTWWGSP